MKSKLFKGLFAGIFLVFMIWFYFGGGLQQKVDSDMQTIKENVAADFIKQYEIAAKNGNSMDAYVHAGVVAQAFLQAKDEANYKKWKDVQDEWAVAVGLKQKK